MQTAVTSRADAPAPMPLFSAGGQSAFGSPQTAPMFSGNTSTAFPGNQEGVSAPEGATLRPTSRPTPGVRSCTYWCCILTVGMSCCAANYILIAAFPPLAHLRWHRQRKQLYSTLEIC